MKHLWEVLETNGIFIRGRFDMKEIKTCEEIFLKLSGLYYTMLPVKAAIKIGKEVSERKKKTQFESPRYEREYKNLNKQGQRIN